MKDKYNDDNDYDNEDGFEGRYLRPLKIWLLSKRGIFLMILIYAAYFLGQLALKSNQLFLVDTWLSQLQILLLGLMILVLLSFVWEKMAKRLNGRGNEWILDNAFYMSLFIFALVFALYGSLRLWASVAMKEDCLHSSKMMNLENCNSGGKCQVRLEDGNIVEMFKAEYGKDFCYLKGLVKLEGEFFSQQRPEKFFRLGQIFFDENQIKFTQDPESYVCCQKVDYPEALVDLWTDFQKKSLKLKKNSEDILVYESNSNTVGEPLIKTYLFKKAQDCLEHQKEISQKGKIPMNKAYSYNCL